MITIPWRTDCTVPVDVPRSFNDDTAIFALMGNGGTVLSKTLIQNGDDRLLRLTVSDTADIPIGYYKYSITIVRGNAVRYSFEGKACLQEVNSSGSVVSGGDIINYINSEEADNDNIHVNTTEVWNAQTDLIGIAGHIYIYTDYTSVVKNGVTVDVPNIKIGDGNAFLIDNPFVTTSVDELLSLHINDISKHVTSVEKDSWNNKVRCYISESDSENIVFTTS